VDAKEQERALERAMRMAPGDQGPRLIFSDWLEEQGRSLEAAALRGGPSAPYLPCPHCGRRLKMKPATLLDHIRARELKACHDCGHYWACGPRCWCRDETVSEAELFADLMRDDDAVWSLSSLTPEEVVGLVRRRHREILSRRAPEMPAKE
jgi:uncharacterized protein (TIGR02996 family)